MFVFATLLFACNPHDVLIDDNNNNNIGNTITHKLIDINSFPTLTITTSTLEWNKLLQNFDLNKDNEEYVTGDFKLEKDGKTYKLSNEIGRASCRERV